jgi:hypothetical protein
LPRRVTTTVPPLVPLASSRPLSTSPQRGPAPPQPDRPTSDGFLTRREDATTP